MLLLTKEPDKLMIAGGQFAQVNPIIRYRTLFIVLVQAAIIFLSLLLAYLLRFDFSLPDVHILFSAAAILIVIRMVPIAYFGLLHGWWRYVGIEDIHRVVKAVASGSVAFWLAIQLVLGVRALPTSIFVLEAILTTVFLIGVRVLSRMVAESARKDLSGARRVALIGAGSAAQMILREIKQPESGIVAIGCLDDDVSKRGIVIEGVPVLGSVDQLSNTIRSHAIEEVLIAVPSANGQQMQRFLEICTQANVKFRTVPALKDIIKGRVSISQLRDVSLEDLLGREPTRIDLDAVRQEIDGRTVLVTGAAGSIGSEVCRQILDYNPGWLTCLDQGETALFYHQRELSKHANGSHVEYLVADINDTERLRCLLETRRPDIIFHVAAYKHVPLMETNVHEAVKNNVFGLLQLVNLAEATGCRSFVFISSDKAVNPTSVMGATKRIGELILAARPFNDMRGVAVRFGNVLGSSGSVIPVLLEQLRNNRPLTITHPQIRRYFMTNHEAVALVLQGLAIGKHGDILVLDMGQAVSIVDLARNLARLSGKREQEVAIKFTGLRPGEKLDEELFYSDEVVLQTSCKKIRRVHGTVYRWPDLQQHLVELQATLSVDASAPVRAKMKEIIPQFDQGESKNAMPSTTSDATMLQGAASGD